jgi:hypothetical protein
MNIALLLLCLVSTSIQPAFANDMLLLEVTGARKLENSISFEDKHFIEQKCELIFDDDTGVFLFGNENGEILFTIEDIERVRLLLEKYLTWEELAVENKVKVYKDLPESVFTTDIVYAKTNRGDYIKESVHFKMVFYSLSETEHYLVIDSGRSEKYSYSLLGEPFYIGKIEVQKMYSSIKDKKIEQCLEAYRNKEQLKELFQ